MRQRALLAAVSVLALVGSANAAILVDYFDLAHSSGELRNTTSTANNDGWADTSYFSGSGSPRVISGLSFANAAYVDAGSGYAVSVGLDNRGFGRAFESSWTGTIWMSYLVHLRSGGGAPKVGLRTAPWSGYGAAIDGVNYVWNADQGVYEAGDAKLSAGETYLAIARYELGAEGSSLTAWHFAEGDVIPTTQAGLDALSGNVLTKSNLANLDGTAGAVATMGNQINVDSFRLANLTGDAGLSAVLIPEPATMGLLAVGVLALLRRRRS